MVECKQTLNGVIKLKFAGHVLRGRVKDCYRMWQMEKWREQDQRKRHAHDGLKTSRNGCRFHQWKNAHPWLRIDSNSFSFLKLGNHQTRWRYSMMMKTGDKFNKPPKLLRTWTTLFYWTVSWKLKVQVTYRVNKTIYLTCWV